MADPTESRLPAEIKAFLTELRNDAALGPLIDTLEIAFRAIDLEGDSVADAIRFQDGVIWVLKHKNRTVLERIDALAKLANADGGKPQDCHSGHAGISRMARMNEFFAEARAAPKFMTAASAGPAVADLQYMPQGANPHMPESPSPV
jgi:hypothetical protein